MFEIWRHRARGERYLVVVVDGRATAAAGPLASDDVPRAVLAQHANQHHNPSALLHMRKVPHEYAREYASDRPGRVVRLPDAPSDAP